MSQRDRPEVAGPMTGSATSGNDRLAQTPIPDVATLIRATLAVKNKWSILYRFIAGISRMNEGWALSGLPQLALDRSFHFAAQNTSQGIYAGNRLSGTIRRHH
jgi:hypothetical protein